MATFVGLRYPVIISVTDFTNPDNLTNDLLILIFLLIKNHRLQMIQLDRNYLMFTKCDINIKQVFFIFHIMELSGDFKTIRSVKLIGTNWEHPVPISLAVQHLEN